MKRGALIVLIVAMGLALASSPIQAAEKAFDFGVNFGVVSDDSFKFSPFTWSAGAEFDFYFGEYLMLSPEVMLWIQKFDFKNLWLIPGAMLNARIQTFFAGAGVVLPIFLSSGTSTVADKFSFKVNAGWMSTGQKLTFYIITPFEDAFKKGNTTFGLTLGFMF